MKKLNEKQKVLLKIMKDIHKISVKNGFKYSLDAGSLLGAVREKGFIEWDNDMDIVISLDQYFDFVETLKKELNYTVLNGLEDKDGRNLMPWTKVCSVDGKDYIDIVPFVFTKHKASRFLVLLWKIKEFKWVKLGEKNAFERFGFTILRTILRVIPSSFIKRTCISKMRKMEKASGDNFFPFWFDTTKRKKMHRKVFNDINREISVIKFEGCNFYAWKNYEGILEFYYGKDWKTPRKKDYYIY